MRINTLRAFIAAALVLASCATSPPVTKGGHKFAATGQTISASYDPSVSGLPGNVGDIVSVAGGATAWVKSGTGVTAWQAFPGATADTSWYGLEAAVHAAAVPELTESVTIPIGISNDGAILGANLVNAGKEGGALRGNSDTLWSTLTKATIFNALNSSKFAISFQASLSAPASGKVSYAGLVNAALTKQIVVATQFSTNATKFLGFGYDTVGLEPAAGIDLGTADANVYTWRIISDGTTITISRSAKGGGGVALSSGTILTSATHLPSDAMLVGIFNSASTTGQAIYKVVYSYVGP